MCGVCGCQVTRSKVVTTAELMAAGSVTVVAGLRRDNDGIEEAAALKITVVITVTGIVV